LVLAGPQKSADNTEGSWEQRIQAHPSDQALYAGYASDLLAARQYAPALAWIDKGLAFGPSDPTLQLRRGIALHALGRTADALQALQPLTDSAEALFYSGLCYRTLGDHVRARQYLEGAWKKGFRDPYALYSLIEEDQAAGEKAAGLAHYETFVREFSDSPWLHALYANAYAAKENYDEARREYREALQLDPNLPGVNFRLGVLLFKSGDHAQAATFFRQELNLNPGYSDANLFLGETLRRLGREAEALGYLRRALEADDRSILAYRSLATALTDKGDLSGAAEILERAEKAFPEDPTFPAQLARLFSRLNRQQDAVRQKERYSALMESQKKR
jgi:tetratricopeptide (TPR) repeat protein